MTGAEDLFEHAACGLLTTRADGVIVRVNATLCHWLGRSAAELTGGTKLHELFTMGGRVFHQTHCLPLLQVQGSVAEVQVDVRHADGSRLPMLMNMARRASPDGALDEVALFLTTERRAYERELLHARQTAEAALEARRGAEAQLLEMNAALSRADRRKDEFLATLAHELRNPLAPISNVVALLKHQRGDAGPGSPVAVLERQVGQLKHLVDDLLEISRVTLGRVDLRCSTLDLGQIVRASADDVLPMVERFGQRLHVDLPALPVTLHADPTRLTQVVANLLTNAVKYTPPGGDIWLAARQEGAQAVVTVRDSGIGIPAESLATVFQMFSQLTPALERAQGGLGIGLALVRGLVELHGGSIAAHSDGAGLGSTFEVRLPALTAATSPCADAARQPEPDPARRRTILVVDDNHDVVDTMSMLLEVTGHDTRAAHDGASALRVAADWLPEVIILDIGLPDLNGYDVARAIRAAPWGGAMFLIAATGWGQDADRQLASAAGFDLHLTKPVDVELLQAALARHDSGAAHLPH